jgi:hypothetical protein
MRKLFYMGFCLVLAMGVGCAITDYGVIIDKYTGEIENTNGKAMIMPASQVATIWSDGADCLFTMVDQKANGDQVLTTYNHYTTDGSYFQDFDYCHPDWTGCAIYTAPNPVMGDVDIFDGTANYNCSGARSYSVRVALYGRYTECGRTTMDRLGATQTMSEVNGKLIANAHRGNTTILIGDHVLPTVGVVPVELELGGNPTLALFLDNPLVSRNLITLHDMLTRYGATQDVVVNFNGFEIINANVQFDLDAVAENAR